MNREEHVRDVMEGALGRGTTVAETVSWATQGTGAQRWLATRALYSLVEEKKASISDPSPPGSMLAYLASFYSLKFWGTVAALVANALLIYVSPPSALFIYMRYVFGSVAVLLLPGYFLTEALYPKKDDLDALERLALSIGLSLTLAPIVGVLLSYSPWGIRIDPIVVFLSILDIPLAVVGALRKGSYIKLASSARR